MFCESCGSKLPDGAKFCAGCGAKTEQVQPVCTAAEQATGSASPNPRYEPFVQSPATPRQPYVPPAYEVQAQLKSEPLSVGQYMGMFLLMCIPILNIILLFVWSFGGSANPGKRNFARAALILSAIMLIIWIIAGGLIMGALDSIMGGYY